MKKWVRPTFSMYDELFLHNESNFDTILSLTWKGVRRMRDRITFKCSVCGEENYIGTRNKKKRPDRMTIKKYCPKCNKMTEHKEKR